MRLQFLRPPSEDRRVVDDRARASLVHVGEHGPQATERAGEGHVQHHVPLVVGHVDDRGVASEAGVVHPDVDAAHLGSGCRDQRPDIRVVGDRFVVPTDVLFESGSADLSPAALVQMKKLAETLNQVAAEIPSNLDWIVRIDGHTDKRPIHTAQFASNWELSTARAVAIVKYLVVQGIPANRLSANGFGQFQPLDPADTPQAYAKNRRIEIQLTNR